MRPTTSASNISRRALCPGSEAMEAGLPEEDSVQSREGRLLHAYDANPKLERAVLTPYQRDLLRISGQCDDFILARVREQFSVSETEPFIEGCEKELVALKGEEGAETVGHCDRFIYWPALKLLSITDKKFGFKEVSPAEANYQLRVYALGGFEEWDVENCVVAITQPRLPYAERITLAAYNETDALAAVKELREIRAKSREPDAPLHAGEDQCRYCKAALGRMCPEYRRVIDSGLAVLPSLDGEMTVRAREAQIERTLAGCSDAQLDSVLLAVQFAGFITDPARDEARARKRRNPDSLPEWTIGKASEMRKIVDSKRAVALLALRGDLTRDEILECASLKIGDLEEKIREKKKLAWKDAKQITEATLAPVLVRESKKQSLTRSK